MKTLFTASLLALAATSLPGQAGIGMLPQDKTPVIVVDSERNPFGKKKVEKATENTITEESRIRAIFDSLPVRGVTGDPISGKVLLGSVFIEEGSEVPPVLPEQTEKLRVLEVREGTVVLGFLEKSGPAYSRKITLRVGLKPHVRFKLPTESTEKSETEKPSALGGITSDNGGPTPQQ